MKVTSSIDTNNALIFTLETGIDLELHGPRELLVIRSTGKEGYCFEVSDEGELRVDGWNLSDLIRSAISHGEQPK